MSTIKTKNIQQTVISGTTQPLKIGGILEDGSDAKISIGSDGITALKGTAQSLETIVDYTVPTTTNSLTISGLNLLKGNTYKLEVYQNSLNTGDVFFYINGNTTNSNYLRNIVRVENGVLGSASGNDALIHYSRINTDSYFSYTFEIGYNNYLNGFSDSIEGHTNAVMRKFTLTTLFSILSITSITLSGSSNILGIGTRIKLVRIA